MKPQSDTTQLSQTLVEIATRAALQVGDMLVDAFNAGVSAEEKAGFYDLVTEYDHKAEETIINFIMEQHPDSTVIGEEGGKQGNGSVHWYIDPIDGTTNFATGLPFFCVSIGAAVNGQIQAGIVFDPVKKEMFAATTNGVSVNGQSLHPNLNAKSDSDAVLITAFPLPGDLGNNGDYELFGQMVSRFKSVRRLGSAALSLAYVAAGRADVAFEPRINPWDVAAGYLIVEQAGGHYIPVGSSLNGTSPWLSRGFIATGPGFDFEQSVMAQFR